MHLYVCLVLDSLSNRCFCACMFDEVTESAYGLNSKSYVLVVLSPFSALTYDLPVEPYGRVSRHM